MEVDPEQEEHLFEAACGIDDPEQRAAFLEEACAGNPSLRLAIDELLLCDETESSLLDTPVFGLCKTIVEHRVDDEIDNYRLIEKVGSGGFGVVWKASQMLPVRREVAIKIIRLGMDTGQILQRFELERQTLAMMNHAHIATIFDAGTTGLGRPYFVMELVDGQPIDAYCDSANLSIHRRLRLFVDTCRAIQHAHLKGVVHRDLKPSNVLVANVEGEATPKVIDFGIAKALPQAGAEVDWSPSAAAPSPNEALATASRNAAESALAGTPAYMSPEQMALGSDVDTRADVYALGAILHTLLVGEPPQRSSAENPQPEHAIESMRSVFAHSSSPEAVARKRGIGRLALENRLEHELQWIVSSATALDIGSRYQSASDLAHDVERYLAGFPLSVGPTNVLYRLKKFIARNSLATTLTLVAALALVGGSFAAVLGFAREREARLFATEQWKRAEKETERATLESEKATRFTQLVQRIVDAADPRSGRPTSRLLRDELKGFSDSLTEHLAEFPLSEARMQRIVGRLFRSWREFEESGPHLKRAFELRRDNLSASHLDLANSQLDYADYLFFIGQIEEAERLLLPAMSILEKAELSQGWIESLALLSRIRRSQKRDTEARAHMYDAWQESVLLHGTNAPLTLKYQSKAARKMLELGKKSTALDLSLEALDKMLKIRPRDHIDVADIKRDLGLLLRLQAKLDEAEKMARESLSIYRELTGNKSIFAASSLVLLARVLQDANRREEAREAGREAVEIADSIHRGGEFTKLNAYEFLSECGVGEEALAAEAKALNVQAILMPKSPALASGRYDYAYKLRTHRRFEDAMHQYNLAVQINIDRLAPPLKNTTILHAMGDLQLEIGQKVQAESYFSKAIETLARNRKELSANEQVILSMLFVDLVESLVDTNKLTEAEQTIAWMREIGTTTGTNTAILQLAVEASLAMASDDFKKAKETLTTALSLSSSEGQAVRFQIRIEELLADCEIELGNVQSAEASLTSLLTRKRTSWFRSIDRRRITSALVKLCQASNQPEKAKTWRATLYDSSSVELATPE